LQFCYNTPLTTIVVVPVIGTNADNAGHRMKKAQRAGKAVSRNTAPTTALLVAIMLLFDPNHRLHERGFLMAAADETRNTLRDKTTPPARDPKAAVEEEYQLARQQGTAQALQLFIARHPDNPLAEKARADLRRLPR
jgi:hypothetical protein